MKRLTDEEAASALFNSRPFTDDISDAEAAIANALVVRGYIRYWKESGWEYWQTTPLGKLAYECYVATKGLT